MTRAEKEEQRRLADITRNRNAALNNLEAKAASANARVGMETIQAARVDVLIESLYGEFVADPETNDVLVCSDARFAFELRVVQTIEAQVDVVIANSHGGLVVARARPNLKSL